MSRSEFEVTYLSKFDNTYQPAMFHPAKGSEPRPLVVALHTWSYGMTAGYDHYLSRCQKRNWHLIHPHFRGPNCTPAACGSEYVVSDIISCVEYVKSVSPVDEKRIYLIGGSGGGHASLLLAGRAPELWAAVSAWCPISDLVAWYAESGHHPYGYPPQIEKACGGNPQTSDAARQEALKRSPITYLAAAKGRTTIDIAAGIHDWHRGSVPVSQSLNAFNLLADECDRFTAEEIDYVFKNQSVPEHLQFKSVDPAFGENAVLLRRESSRVRLTIFEGGHDILAGPGFGFLDNQKLGAAPIWNSGDVCDNNTANELSQ